MLLAVTGVVVGQVGGNGDALLGPHQKGSFAESLDAIEDPEFREFAAKFQTVLHLEAQKMLRLPPQQRAEFIEGLEQISCSNKECTELRDHYETYDVPFELAPLRQLHMALRALLKKGWKAERISSEVIRFAGIENQLHETDRETDDDVTACQEDCQRTYLIAAATAMTAYISGLAGCTALGPVAWIPCYAAVTWAYAWAVTQAGQNAEECVEDCEQRYGGGDGTDGDDSSSSDEEYCEQDSDCASDEWCDKGTLGVGQNECKPKKEEGQVCVRDSQCETDCCKFYWYFWQCRPSSKCD